MMKYLPELFITSLKFIEESVRVQFYFYPNYSNASIVVDRVILVLHLRVMLFRGINVPFQLIMALYFF